MLASVVAQAQRYVRAELIPLPPPMQFINQILRPCGSGATPFVSAIAAADGDFDITTCTGRSVTVNGVPLVLVPGGGLSDPGSNGYVVRTALNTTIARTFTVTAPITVTNATGVAGNTGFACPTCVTSAAALTSTAIITGAGAQAVQVPSATTTLAANGDISTPGSITTGNAGGANGALDLSGLTSGTVTVTVNAVAGTWNFTLPADDGTPGQVLQTDGTGITTWQTPAAGFTCAGCTLNKVQKGDGAGNLSDSQIIDNGTATDIGLIVGGSFTVNNGFVGNGVNFKLDNPNNTVTLQSDGNNFGQALTLDGGASQSASLRASGNGGTVTLNLKASAGNNAAEFSTTEVVPNGTTTNLGSLTTAGNRWQQAFFDATITAGGTTGAQTINKSAGSVNFAAAATSLVVTSNKVTANSIVMCTVATNDTTLKSVQCVPTAGSFTMFANAAATAETRVNFWILNQ